MTHCRRADSPKLCEADFPRTLWLARQPVVLWQGLLRKMNLPIGGRRNQLGSLHGPMNEENLNGTHPALLAAEGSFNSDVQLPYRLPVCVASHAPSDLCDCGCPAQHDENEVIEGTQIAEDAQAGYACDYSNKRSAKTFNEVKEFRKGHRTLPTELEGERPAYLGKRYATRLCSDAYGKGVVRSNKSATTRTSV